MSLAPRTAAAGWFPALGNDRSFLDVIYPLIVMSEHTVAQFVIIFVFQSQCQSAEHCSFDPSASLGPIDRSSSSRHSPSLNVCFG